MADVKLERVEILNLRNGDATRGDERITNRRLKQVPRCTPVLHVALDRISLAYDIGLYRVRTSTIDKRSPCDKLRQKIRLGLPDS